MAQTFAANQITDSLQKGLQQMHLNLSAQVVSAMVTFLAELERWNKAYNLTAVRDPQEMVSRHVLDSLTALPYVNGERVLDVGTGAGLPGIPLALALPERQFTLLDSNGKKQRFVTHASGVLKLANVTAVHERVENYMPPALFDTVVCRALTSLKDFASGSGQLVSPTGQLVAMKGKHPQDEIDALPDAWQVIDVLPQQVPQLIGERHIVILQAKDQALKLGMEI